MNDTLDNFEDDLELDPRMRALLDEALSADHIEAPAGMTDRIVAATMPMLAATRPAVVGRIGGSGGAGGFAGSFVMRFAAGLLVAASVGVAIVATNLRQDAASDEAARLAADARRLTTQASLAMLPSEIEQALSVSAGADTFALADTSIDRSIDLLKTRADEISAGVEQWATVTETLESELNDMENPDNG